MGHVVLFSIAAMANPTLVAATTVMLLLPSPSRLMIGYLLGALMTSVTLGLVIVFAAKNSGVVSTAQNTINPAVDLAIGAILLTIAVVLNTGRDKPFRERRAARHADEPDKTPRWRQAIGKGDPKITFAVGAVLTLPGASYLAALSGVVKLKASTGGTVLLVLLVNLIMLALLEVPLISFAVAPKWTPLAIERAKASLSRNGRKIASIVTGTIGALLIVQGLITLLS